MRKKDGLRIILLLLLLADTAYTFRQHKMKPLPKTAGGPVEDTDLARDSRSGQPPVR
ncbi:hypothetical protein [Phaeodactylibacter xiamenensis]|uniref:hypothetical protein n=1 Tax=Phaeodactylibacter xiamenensis TaxID=1524460 RepID=UPI0024A8AABC|nr:hypothetical protein [Phaeodactylibacter xiamenensis]